MSGKTRVTIQGRTWTVKGDDDIDVAEVARYVDARMSEMAGRTRAADPSALALVTSLNIASDYRRLQLLAVSEIDRLEKELAAAKVLLDAALRGAAADDEREVDADEEAAADRSDA